MPANAMQNGSKRAFFGPYSDLLGGEGVNLGGKVLETVPSGGPKLRNAKHTLTLYLPTCILLRDDFARKYLIKRMLLSPSHDRRIVEVK